MSALPEPRRIGGASLQIVKHIEEIDPYTEGLPEEVSLEWNNR